MMPAMTDTVIFLRPTRAEKELILAAAARKRRSQNEYALEAILERAKQDLKDVANPDVLRHVSVPKSDCRHCGRPLARGNETRFCRNCQRTVGLPTLRKLHSKEEGHGKSVPRGSPLRSRKRR